jgi:hypothetical protein
MLRGLPGIRLKLVKLACTVLWNISTSGIALQAPFIFGMDPPSTIFRFGSTSHPSRGASSVPR